MNTTKRIERVYALRLCAARAQSVSIFGVGGVKTAAAGRRWNLADAINRTKLPIGAAK